MIREYRELLAELARITREMPPFGMRIMDGSASVAEQAHYAQRLIAVAKLLNHRAMTMGGEVIKAEVFTENKIAISAYTSEPHLKP